MKTIYFFQLFPDELNVGFHFPYNATYVDDITYYKAILLQIGCLKMKECGIEFLAQTYEDILKTLEVRT